MKLSSFRNNEQDILSNRDDMIIVTFANPFSYYKIKDDRLDLEMDYIFADAISLVMLNNALNQSKIERASFDFTSVAPVVFDYCKKKNLRVGIFGGSDVEVSIAKIEIENRFGSIVDVCHHGYFELDNQSVYDLINENSIDVVISSMGTPKQEKFLLEVKKYCPNVIFGFTSGGFLSQIASRPDYFNENLSKFNMRWLQRAIRHKYVRQRLLKDYPKFLIRYLREEIRK